MQERSVGYLYKACRIYMDIIPILAFYSCSTWQQPNQITRN